MLGHRVAGQPRAVFDEDRDLLFTVHGVQLGRAVEIGVNLDPVDDHDTMAREGGGVAEDRDPPCLLAAPEPDAHAEAMAAVGEVGQKLSVLGGPAPEILAGDQPAPGRGGAAVARQAGADEGLVGQVVSREE